jgi:predicted MFS family arabinose efflux permease
LLAVIQNRLLSRVKAKPISKEKLETVKSIQLIKEAILNLKNYKDFRLYTILAFLFHVSWHMGWPLFFIYQVDVIGINEAWLSYVNVAIGLAGVLTYNFWGKAIERKGAQLVLLVGTFGLCFNALTIVLIHSKAILLFQNTLLGLTFSAFNLAIFQNLIEVVPQKNKTINIGVYTTLLYTSQLISPMVGVWLYKQTSIVTALVWVGVLRFIASALFAARFFYTRKRKKSIN